MRATGLSQSNVKIDFYHQIRIIPNRLLKSTFKYKFRKGKEEAVMVKSAIKDLSRSAYPLSINYDLELKELEEIGRYDRSIYIIDPNSKPPTENRGERFALFELVHLNRRISNSEAELALKRLGYYPADIYALLTFGVNYPYIQSIFTIAGIAYSLRVYHRHIQPRKFEMVGMPFLIGDGKERIFDFRSAEREWSEMTRFLATRDRSMRILNLMKYWKWW